VGLSEFRLTLKKQDKLAVESTGNSNYFYQQMVKSVDKIIVVNPSQFNVIRNSVKKTDKNDARALAFYLSKEMLPESRVKSEAHIQVARISHSREQLVKTRTSLINKLHGIFNSLGYKLKKEILTTQKGLNSLLQYNLDELTKMEVSIFKQQIEQLTQGIKQMDALLQGAGEKLSGFENINSIKGIGQKSASILLSCIGDIKDFESADKLAAYFGIVPRVSNSNETERSGRITKRGTKLGRTTLVQCTLVAIRYSDFLRSFYEKIKAKKGSGKAIIATARKMLKTIYLTLKNNWVFEDFPNYVLRKN
jgi:transposase